ncbi:MAG TPA: enoyl-CoA hydratase-related protein [Desulfomonilaceae bacterium]|nr:enoyl-CoA hydratase-related protein [Desulfomonilaceae bacterium]
MNESATRKEGLVTYHREGHLGFITLNRPEKLNAINMALWNALGTVVDQAGQDTEARVILVRGEGRCFSAGLDLSPDNEVLSQITGTPDASQKMAFYKDLRRLHQIHNNLECLRQPTIGVIHGHCIGAGLELALCCDIRFCSADAKFALPEAKFAIITDVGGLQRLPQVVGKAHAREMAFRGHRIDAKRAQAIGLVNDVYPDKEALDRGAEEIALEIAGNAPLAVQGAKDVFLLNEEVPLDRALDYNAAKSSMILPSEDLLEAISAYLQKREAKFKGA